MKTAGQLRTEIYAQIFPSGRPEPLADSVIPGVLSAQSQHFQEALADVAKWVRCEQVNVVDTVDFCKTFFKCGMTVTRMPNGNIWRVMTIVGDDFCQPITYREVNWPDVECLGRRAMLTAQSLPDFPTSLPWGFSPADASTDNQCGRALAGIWCKHDGNIYVAPWIQSVEKLVIEYNGVKTKWEDGDPVSEEQDYRLALQLYCQYAHERDYGSPEKSAYYKMGMPAGSGGYDRALAELIWTCEEKLKVRETTICAGWCRNLLSPVVEETGIAEPATDLVLAHVGQVASGADADRAAVATLVDGFTPSAVLCSGNALVGVSVYDSDVGLYWQKYIFPYYGSHGDGAAETNAFWPAPGRGDWDLNALADWLAFFATPDARRYYDVCLWPVHLFFYDSEDDEPNGVADGSIQAQWLKSKMALSPAPWKVVVMYGNPYASGVPAGSTWPNLLLQYKSWGASMVLSGGLPYYERLDVAGVPFIINGCGGATLAGAANAPITQSALIRVGSFGAGKLTANETLLKYEFTAIDSTIIDTVSLTK